MPLKARLARLADILIGKHWLGWSLRLALRTTALASLGIGLFLAGLLAYYSSTLPEPMALHRKEQAPLVKVLARDGSLLAERGSAAGYIPFDFLPKHLIDAVVATEDRRFFSHWGVDPWGLIRASMTNWRAGHVSQGGSTLTQQLAKNLFLSSRRTYGRKLEELVLALWLEMKLSKHDILELYLNHVYLGSGAYGVEAASRRYFGKSVRNISLTEATVLAGLLKAPTRYSPASNPVAARARAHIVLQSMAEAGLITRDRETAARRAPLAFATERLPAAAGSEYAVDMALERLPPLLATGDAELVVETTIEPTLQQFAQTTLANRLAADGASRQASQAALVLLDGQGAIRALVGGRSYAESQFNRATKARRQPGSAFKPIVYLTALERGFTPDTIVYDLPVSIGGWTPRNDDGQYQGPISLRQALSRSANTIAVRLLLDTGARRVAATARRLGITSELHEGPSLALGASEVTLLELTGAYANLASGGLKTEPHIIRKVRLSSGKVLYARSDIRPQRIIAPTHVAGMADLLSSAVATGTGRKAALAQHMVAGKTGTTTEFRDAWFIGYTGHLTAGVWVGNDDSSPMQKVTGGSLPASIWHDVMQSAHATRAPTPLAGDVRPDQERADQPVLSAASVRQDEPTAPRELLPWAKPAVPPPQTDRAGNPRPLRKAESSTARPAAVGENGSSPRSADDPIARILSSRAP